jgi:hypothetical protein
VTGPKAIEMIAPHKHNRKKPAIQDGVRLELTRGMRKTIIARYERKSRSGRNANKRRK